MLKLDEDENYWWIGPVKQHFGQSFKVNFSEKTVRVLKALHSRSIKRLMETLYAQVELKTNTGSPGYDDFYELFIDRKTFEITLFMSDRDYDTAESAAFIRQDLLIFVEEYRLG